MTDNVIILGAGFSYDAGIPLLGGFVDKMLEFYNKKTVNGKPLLNVDYAIFENVVNTRRKIDGFHGRARLNDRNIEDLLSILSFLALESDLKSDDMSNMIKAIAKTIDLCCSLRQVEFGKFTAANYSPYTDFWIKIISHFEATGSIPAIITFNYDLVLERSLLSLLHGAMRYGSKKYPFDTFQIIYDCKYAESPIFEVQYADHYDRHSDTRRDATFITKTEKKSPHHAEFRIYKPHGSLNFSKSFPAESIYKNTTATVNDPVILPPIFNKMDGSDLNSVWVSASKSLNKAKNVNIIGYSMPTTDIYMQYFLKSAIGKNDLINSINVFDPILFSTTNTQGALDLKNRYWNCFSQQMYGIIDFNPGKGASSAPRGTLMEFVETLSSDEIKLFY